MFVKHEITHPTMVHIQTQREICCKQDEHISFQKQCLIIMFITHHKYDFIINIIVINFDSQSCIVNIITPFFSLMFSLNTFHSGENN